MRVLRPLQRRSWCGPGPSGARSGTRAPSTLLRASETSSTVTSGFSAPAGSPSPHSMTLTSRAPPGRGIITHAPASVRCHW